MSSLNLGRIPGGKAGLAVIALAIAFYMPYILSSSYWILVAASVCVFAIFGLSYNLLLGQLGLFSLGHAMFFGIGGYVIANLLQDGSNVWVGLGLALLITILLAFVVGAATLRVPGIYFAIVTVAIAQAIYTAATRNVFDLTGGENGIYLSDLPEWLNVNTKPDTVYWVTLVALLATIVVIGFLRRSPMGRNWEGIRENPVRAESLGLNVRVHQLIAFTIAGGIAGFAGVLNAVTQQVAAPDQLGLAIMIQVLLIVVIGGPGTFLGPVLGAIFVVTSGPLLDQLERVSWVEGLPEVLNRMITSQPMVLGVVYILLVLFLPGGLASLTKRFRWLENLTGGKPGDGPPKADPALNQ